MPLHTRAGLAARRRQLVRATLLALAGLACGMAASAQAQPLYTVTALPLTGFTAFNDRGQILGRAFLPCSGLCTAGDSAVLFDSATGTSTGLGGGFGSVPQYGALNALGQLAGSQTRIDGTGATVRSVVIRQPDGTLGTVLPPVLAAGLVGPLQPRGLNASGQIALQHSDGLDLLAPNCGTYAGWLGSTAGSWTALGPAGMLLSLSGLNASGRAVGAAVASAGCGAAGAGWRAVAADADGRWVDLHGSAAGSFSRARAVNDLGYAVGEADSGQRTLPDNLFPQGLAITHATVWNTASLARFDLGPAGTSSRLNGVNNRGEVVGAAVGPVSANQPTAVVGVRTVAVIGNLATTATLADLNGLLSQNGAGWVLQEALAINTSGQIVARGTTASGSGYVLLTPLQPPADPYAVLPSAPASLSAVLSPSPVVQLAWLNTARNATWLVVERCKGSGCTGFAAVATLAGDVPQWRDATAARRSTYRYRLRAGNAAGLSAAGNVATVTTLR